TLPEVPGKGWGCWCRSREDPEKRGLGQNSRSPRGGIGLWTGGDLQVWTLNREYFKASH
ncbi:hypothetical protein scyTo_0025138, partial [Scyliorhinus torazame]|nr:hypothetical protein [Scyliorhinus torazame]